jgi:hypothetical protein
MRESRSKRHIYVSRDGDAAPYVIVPRAEVERVGRLFLRHGVSHSLRERAGQEYAVFDLGQDANVAEVQAVLDSVVR